MTKPGRYGDGNGLYLTCSSAGASSWTIGRSTCKRDPMDEKWLKATLDAADKEISKRLKLSGENRMQQGGPVPVARKPNNGQPEHTQTTCLYSSSAVAITAFSKICVQFGSPAGTR